MRRLRTFGSFETASPHLGPTPKRSRSGGSDATGCLSNTGDAGVGAALEAADIIPTRPVEETGV